MTKRELESKTVVELKGIARGKISIPSKINKGDLVKLLVKYFRKLKSNINKEENTTSIVSSTSVSKNSGIAPLPDFPNKIVDFGNSTILTTIQVSCGALTYQLPSFEGKSITDIKAILRDQLDISSATTYSNIVDGQNQELDYVFKGTEKRLEFLKSAGQKGIN